MTRPFLRLMVALAIVSVLPLAPAVLAGQIAARLSGPLVGYVWSPEAGRLHPLQGIPGSATIGAPVRLDVEITQAIALTDRHVLASAAGVRELLVVDAGVDPPLVRSVADTAMQPTRFAASPRGSAAAIYDATAARVVILTGLPDAPVPAWTIDAALYGGSITQMAVSDDGTLLVYAVREGELDTIHLWASSSSFSRVLSTAGRVGALTLTASGAVVVADRDADEVFMVRNVGGAAVRQSVASAGDGVADPIGLAVSGKDRLYVVNAGTGSIMTLSQDGLVLRSQSCGCVPSGLYPVRESVFRLTAALNQTMYLFDVTGANERVLFVPPLPPD